MAKAQGIYTITDTVAEMDSPVFQQANDVLARREFSAFLKKVPYPADYTLKRLGWVENGLLVPDVEISLEDTINTEVEEDA